MELKDSKTMKNLFAAFAGESQAHTKYQYYAAKARENGFEQIAAIFEETAKNEKEQINGTPANSLFRLPAIRLPSF